MLNEHKQQIRNSTFVANYTSYELIWLLLENDYSYKWMERNWKRKEKDCKIVIAKIIRINNLIVWHRNDVEEVKG